MDHVTKFMSENSVDLAVVELERQLIEQNDVAAGKRKGIAAEISGCSKMQAP